MPITDLQSPTALMVDLSDIRDFMTGGKAYFTVVHSSGRFTYRVKAGKRKEGFSYPPYYVSLLTGSNNRTDYTYMGVMFVSRRDENELKYNPATSSSIDPKASSSVTFMNFLSEHFTGRTLRRVVAPEFEFWHDGRCSRCGRKLTDPESIQRGLGKECAKKV